ncbi:hypothetical protein EGW08_007641 [Elysia chlorotica]|uniref:Fibronectin type-III domain-containing protein n=1 Tax=Elysia chlorotica TaxID=188477 RepID=A0A3S1BN26_ELYCH|nr:hypothetical protein EGW08_007641 [Elysia chlorotica]
MASITQFGLKRTRFVYYQPRSKVEPPSKLALRTEEESKLSQILSQQRRYHQQLQQQHPQQQHLQNQPQQRTRADAVESSEGHSSGAALLSPVPNGPQVATPGDTSHSEDHSGGLVEGTKEAHHHLPQSERLQVWADPTSLNALSKSGRYNSNDLHVQDISNDCDARSNVSQLESDSVYLPFNIPASPIVLRRPYTAPDKKLSQVEKNTSTNTTTAKTSTTAAGFTSHLGRGNEPSDAHISQRPQTSAGSVPSPERGNRYETLEQRPIRPLNQQLSRWAGGGVLSVSGGSRPSFEIARPLSSSSEPSVVGRSHHSKEGPALPTSLACSQDYESSEDQTTAESESESATVPVTTSSTTPQTSTHASQAICQPSHHFNNPIPQSGFALAPHSTLQQNPSSGSDSNLHIQLTPGTREKLNHIRSVAGSRKSAVSNAASAAAALSKTVSLQDKAAAVARIRDGIPITKSSSGSTSNRSNTVTSSSTGSTVSTTSSTLTASSLAASAVMRAHKLKSSSRHSSSHHSTPDSGGGDGSHSSSAFVKNENSSRSKLVSSVVYQNNVSYHPENQNGTNELREGETPRVGGKGMVSPHLGAGDSKEVKSRLNLERMEQQREGALTGVRDSGFLSRPPSEVVKEEPQHADNRAATSIQAFWRGYWAREHNALVVSARKEIRARRAEDHIMLLRNDLEKNRKLYEEEKRLRILQMEAIKILYHEVQALKSQSPVAPNNVSRGEHQSPHQATMFSSSNSSPSLSAVQGSPVAATKTGVSPHHTLNAFCATDTSLMGYTDFGGSSINSELNRTQELERTCASLQSQVSQLHEALESVSSAVFRSNSLEGANFDLTDHSDTIRITPYMDSQMEDYHSTDDSSHWCCIPHSLSPYPSEEEEQYYPHVPVKGAPTPPKRLTLRHHSRSALLLSWQPSSCSDHRGEEEEGNRHIIGYRVFVNDQLKAFVYQKTCALVEGLNPSMTYKFYVKALSGFGESFESNYRMAKLAKGGERFQKPRQASSGDSAQDSDSDKDFDSTENTSEKLRKRNKKMRKSPRLAGEKRKSSGKVSQRNHYHHHGELMSPRSDSELSLNHNTSNSAVEQERSSPLAILRHAKLHTHRGSAASRAHSSRETTVAKDSYVSDTASTTSKEPSPIAGSTGRPSVMKKDPAEMESSATSAGAVLGKSGSRRLPNSPKLSNQESSLPSQSQHVAHPTQASDRKHARRGDHIKTAEEELASEQEPKEDLPSSSKPISSLSGDQRKESLTQNVRRERSKTGSRQNSPQISPTCGSSEVNMSKAVKLSPHSGISPAVPLSPPVDGNAAVSNVGTEDVQTSHSSSMSETFTVDKANSFLQSVSANAKRGHRRTRSRDFQAEKLVSEDATMMKEQNKGESESEKSISSGSNQRDNRSIGVSDGKRELERKTSGDSDGKRELESSSISGTDVNSKARGHRRKRSKDLNNAPSSEWQAGAQDEERKEGSESGDRVESKVSESSCPPSENRSIASKGRSIVLDGRRRHSSGSRPSSPSVAANFHGGAGSEERTRISVAEIMIEQRRMLNKSSSLNSLSGRSEDGSIARSEVSHKRSPSIESLPGSSRGETSKRTISNESLQSGGSSRGECGGSSSKRTHSSESLVSIRTDTSKQSHSNESLSGSAPTESSRRFPSNESLTEGTREEAAEQKQQQQVRSNPRRTQSMGSARDIGRRGEGGSSHSRGSNRMSDLLLKLESITKNNSTSVKEKKESLMVKQSMGTSSGGGGEEGDVDRTAKHSDEERQRGGRRSRNLSESDTEGGGVSDPGSQLPPRAPSDSSSGSHSDDNKHARRGHRRTPSDHRPPTSLPPEGDLTRPTHSPIIMEGGPMRKTSSSGGSTVLRNQSFHGILPSKHQDTKASPSSTEDIASKPEDQPVAAPAPQQMENPSRHRPHLRSRSPSPAKSRQPVLSATQLKKHSDGSGS